MNNQAYKDLVQKIAGFREYVAAGEHDQQELLEYAELIKEYADRLNAVKQDAQLPN